MTRRRLALLGLAAATLAAVVAGGAILLLGDDAEPGAQRQAGSLERCANMFDDAARDCYARQFQLLLDDADDLHAALGELNATVRATGGSLLADCHGLMHGVGRHYVRTHGVTVSTLMRYLPKTNDPGCPAGFAHGLVTGVAPQIDPRRPRAAAAVCGEADTRFQRYSCTHGFGHAFMRINDDRLPPALELCRALGRNAAPDCAQGAFHDYWFAVIGYDDAKRPANVASTPQELCAGQRPEFVRPCWYRAFIDTRPAGYRTASTADIERLCTGLAGVQRAGCVTAASAIGPADPAIQLAICAEGLPAEDAVSCIQGTKVQNIIGYPVATYLDVIGRCDAFARATRAACYRWLGKTLAVITDGGFEREGCPRVPGGAARAACLDGARSLDEPLVTFS